MPVIRTTLEIWSEPPIWSLFILNEQKEIPFFATIGLWYSRGLNIAATSDMKITGHQRWWKLLPTLGMEYYRG